MGDAERCINGRCLTARIARKAAIASSSCGGAGAHNAKLFQVLTCQIREAAASYFARPRLRSQTTTSMMASQ